MEKLNLEAIRRILLMTSAEAAKHLVRTKKSPEGVNETTWNRWERGVKPLPEDAAQYIQSIVAKRKIALLAKISVLENGGLITADWAEPESNYSELINWFVQRSINAELIALGAKWSEYGK